MSERMSSCNCSIYRWWCHYAQLNFCEYVIEFSRCMFVWCKLENENKDDREEEEEVKKASRISFSFFFFFKFYLKWMYKWISLSFVIETSSRRFAPLITSCWCNTSDVSTLTRLSFSVSPEHLKILSNMLAIFYLSKRDNDVFISRQTDRPSFLFASIFPLFSFFFVVVVFSYYAAVHFLYMLRHRIFYATLIIIGKYLYRSLSTERNK